MAALKVTPASRRRVLHPPALRLWQRAGPPHRPHFPAMVGAAPQALPSKSRTESEPGAPHGHDSYLRPAACRPTRPVAPEVDERLTARIDTACEQVAGDRAGLAARPRDTVNPHWGRIGRPLRQVAARLAVLGDIRVFPSRDYLKGAGRRPHHPRRSRPCHRDAACGAGCRPDRRAMHRGLAQGLEPAAAAAADRRAGRRPATPRPPVVAAGDHPPGEPDLRCLLRRTPGRLAAVARRGSVRLLARHHHARPWHRRADGPARSRPRARRTPADADGCGTLGPAAPRPARGGLAGIPRGRAAHRQWLGVLVRLAGLGGTPGGRHGRASARLTRHSPGVGAILLECKDDVVTRKAFAALLAE